MEEKQSKSSCDRRGVQSLFIPTVPQIILNTNERADQNVGSSMQHSRSAGELAMCTSSTSGSSNRTSPGSVMMCNGGKDGDSPSRNVIDIYCSPRMPRRTINQTNSIGHFEDDNSWLESNDPNCLSNKLGPGSRQGSAVSLTSEYTSRSVGLISNDSSSDSTQFSDKLEQIKQKQNLLRRYVSNPEKQQLETAESHVQRCAKSVNNLNHECPQQMLYHHGDQPDDTYNDIIQMASKMDDKDAEYSGEGYNPQLVTMVTDELAIKEGRVRQWLTEIGSGTPND